MLDNNGLEARDGARPRGASWGEPLERLDAGWQRLEAGLCTGVLVAEIVSLTLWVLLRGLSTDYSPTSPDTSGLLCRSWLAATILGLAAHLATRRLAPKVHTIIVVVAVIVGFLSAKSWAHAGVHWSSNLLQFLQNASCLMLIGGLRGLATRLTLWAALLGASLATSRGKHIHVDVVVRYVPPPFRTPAAIASWVAAALVCASAVVGFLDYMSIAEFRASAVAPCADDPNRQCDSPSGPKIATVGHEISADLFLLGRQASLDLKSLPRVLAGVPYDQWMTAADWNAWLDGADWAAHFDKGAVDSLHADTSVSGTTHMPQVTSPGTGDDPHGLLIRELNFVFPFGLAVIALKFLVRILLALAGRIDLDPEAELDDPELTHAHERDDDAAKGVPA